MRRPSPIGNRNGVMGLLLAITLVIISVAAFGSWGILRRWRHLVETQYALDHCVGGAALELRNILGKLKTGDERIRKLRLALAAATLLPEARPAVQLTLEVVARKQDFEQASWKLRQARWLAERGCGGSVLRLTPLPGLPVHRPPRDELGPQPLVWKADSASASWTIRAVRSPRKSAARVMRAAVTEKGALNESDFSAEWTDFP